MTPTVSQVARPVTGGTCVTGYPRSMKLPTAVRQVTRTMIGVRAAEPIGPAQLQALARREDVVVVAVGMLAAGHIHAALPGEQRAASLASLATVLADVPHDRAIVLHCG